VKNVKETGKIQKRVDKKC